MKILIVEDNIDMNNALVKGLTLKGYSCDASFDGDDAMGKTQYNEYDLILLDLNLPNKNGIEIAKEIRKTNSKIPLLALTARDSLDDKLKGFKTGFDDYLTKPFEFAELIARIEALIRRSKPNIDFILSKDEIFLDPGKREVKKKNKIIDLTKIEFNILEYLLRKKGVVVSNSELIEHVWAEEPDLIDPPIRSHLKNLRRKIGDNDLNFIKTIPGIGYKIE